MSSSYTERRRVEIANGRWNAWVDPAPVLAHIRQLHAEGWPLAAIQRQAGLSASTFSNLLWPRGDHAVSAKVRPSTAARLLAVTALDLAAAMHYVPAYSTRRRLQALACNGWGIEAIARHIGRNAPALRRVAKNLTDYCHTDTARAVAQAFDELWDQRPPESQYAAATRRTAARRGWLPALAWDDIDDPAECPDRAAVVRTPGNAMRDRIAELGEGIDDLTTRGWSAERIAEHLGVSMRTVDRHRARQHQHQEAS